MVNWPQADLDALYRSRGSVPPSSVQLAQSKPAKIKYKVTLGECVEHSFFVSGLIPSKKNENRAGARIDSEGLAVPNVYKTKEVKALLYNLTSQCVHTWKRLQPYPLTDARIHLHFCVSHRRQDLDNVTSAIMDSLVEGKVIRTDSMVHVIENRQTFQLVAPGAEGVNIHIRGQQYIETPIQPTRR